MENMLEYVSLTQTGSVDVIFTSSPVPKWISKRLNTIVHPVIQLSQPRVFIKIYILVDIYLPENFNGCHKKQMSWTQQLFVTCHNFDLC